MQEFGSKTKNRKRIDQVFDWGEQSYQLNLPFTSDKTLISISNQGMKLDLGYSGFVSCENGDNSDFYDHEGQFFAKIKNNDNFMDKFNRIEFETYTEGEYEDLDESSAVTEDGLTELSIVFDEDEQSIVIVLADESDDNTDLPNEGEENNITNIVENLNNLTYHAVNDDIESYIFDAEVVSEGDFNSTRSYDFVYFKPSDYKIKISALNLIDEESYLYKDIDGEKLEFLVGENKDTFGVINNYPKTDESFLMIKPNCVTLDRIEHNEKGQARTSVVEDGFAYITHNLHHLITKYNIETNNYEWILNLKEEIGVSGTALIRAIDVDETHVYYAPRQGTDSILKIDKETGTYEKIFEYDSDVHTEITDFRYESLTLSDDTLYCSYYNGPIIALFSKDGDFIKEIDLSGEKFFESDSNFTGLFIKDSFLYFLEYDGAGIVKFDINSEEIVKYTSLHHFTRQAVFDDEYIYVMDAENLYKLDFDLNIVRMEKRLKGSDEVRDLFISNDYLVSHDDITIQFSDKDTLEYVSHIEISPHTDGSAPGGIIGWDNILKIFNTCEIIHCKWTPDNLETKISVYEV